MKKRLLSFLIAVVTIAAAWAATTTLRGETEPRRVEVSAKRFGFSPNELTLKKGEPVTLVLKSEDVEHGLLFRELGVDVKAPKGGQGQVQFTPQKTGDFVGHCSVFCGSGHGSMTLTLHVVE